LKQRSPHVDVGLSNIWAKRRSVLHSPDLTNDTDINIIFYRINFSSHIYQIIYL